MGEGSQEQVAAPQGVDIGELLAALSEGEVEAQGLIPWSSNYTFLVTVKAPTLTVMAIYKPRRGESPLWDFPAGTLCLREMASYVVSQMLGWPFIPPTVLRDGPHGLGTLQFCVYCDLEANYFTFQQERQRDLLPIALFDAITNNADRKGGHCLLGHDGRIWAVDHGLTFHTDRKLRTVIWDFAGQPIPTRYLQDLDELRSKLVDDGAGLDALTQLLAADEIAAFRQRIERLLHSRRFPVPHSNRPYPWPPV